MGEDQTNKSTALKRTRREWDAPCKRCGGTGVVHERESFSLWTPDEYEHVRPIKQTLGTRRYVLVPADAYVCTAAPGGKIWEACAEAEGLARTVGRPVAFECNGTVAVVRAGDDPKAIVEEWWVRAYGKTQAQSARDR